MQAIPGQLCVVLVEPRNPLNIGAAARAMSNFGFLDLRVVNPYDVAFREARSAVGAAELLANAQEYKTLAEAVADCTLVVGTTAVRHRELQHPLKRLEAGARVIRKQLASGRWRWCSARKNLVCRPRTSATATGSCAFRRVRNISR